MNSHNGFFAILGSVFLSIFRSRGVLISGLLSVLVLVADLILWPLVNQTEFFWSLYLVDFLNYVFYFLFFVILTRAVSSKLLEDSKQRDWIAIGIAIALLALDKLIFQNVVGAITDLMTSYWVAVASNVVGFAFFLFLIVFSTTAVPLSSALSQSASIFLKNLHWFFVYFLVTLSAAFLTSYAPTFWNLDAEQLRLYSGTKDIVLRYLGSALLVAVILRFATPRKQVDLQRVDEQ